jgi:hypothetical protein
MFCIPKCWTAGKFQICIVSFYCSQITSQAPDSLSRNLDPDFFSYRKLANPDVAGYFTIRPGRMSGAVSGHPLIYTLSSLVSFEFGILYCK